MSDFELYYNMLEEHPYLFGLSQPENLEAIGANRVRRIPGFDYRGNGIIIGFADTGIDYTHPAFLQADGSSRVRVIWAQDAENGMPPEGFGFGGLFGPEEIRAGTAPKDEKGHGTFLAGVAAGREDSSNNFFGVAPGAELAVVKLREAPQQLKEYFFVRPEATAFSEADIMQGVRFLLEYAAAQGKPLVLCLSVCAGLGSHRGTIPLSLYLNSLVYRPDVCVVTAVGNEGNAGHHGRFMIGEEPQDAELYVERQGKGFTLEIFAEAIADLKVRIISPAGDDTPVLGSGFSGEERFPMIFDRSVVYVERESLMRAGTMQRIRVRLERPSAGIWRFRFGRSGMAAEVNLWLPTGGFLEGEVYFTEPDTEMTLCEPANAPLLLTVGGYSTENGGPAPFSGRGFTAEGLNQPALLAPSVSVNGPFAGGGYVIKSGTSIGAAYTAGCVALFMEYIGEYRRTGAAAAMDTVLLRSLFSLGAVREEGIEYPSPVYGYGILNLYGVFEFLRNL